MDRARRGELQVTARGRRGRKRKGHGRERQPELERIEEAQAHPSKFTSQLSWSRQPPFSLELYCKRWSRHTQLSLPWMTNV